MKDRFPDALQDQPFISTCSQAAGEPSFNCIDISIDLAMGHLLRNWLHLVQNRQMQRRPMDDLRRVWTLPLQTRASTRMLKMAEDGLQSRGPRGMAVVRTDIALVAAGDAACGVLSGVHRRSVKVPREPEREWWALSWLCQWSRSLATSRTCRAGGSRQPCLKKVWRIHSIIC